MAAGATLSGSAINNNAGVVDRNAGTLTRSAVPMINAGTLNSNAATSIVNGGLTNSGIVNARNQVNGAILNQGAGAFNVAGNLAGNSSFTNGGYGAVPGQLRQFHRHHHADEQFDQCDGHRCFGIADAEHDRDRHQRRRRQYRGERHVDGRTAPHQFRRNSGQQRRHAQRHRRRHHQQCGRHHHGRARRHRQRRSQQCRRRHQQRRLSMRIVASNTGTITNNGIWTGNVVSNTGTINNNLTWTGDGVECRARSTITPAQRCPVF